MYNRVPIGLMIEMDHESGYKALMNVLSNNNGNVSKSAVDIGVARSTVKRWIVLLEKSGYSNIRNEIDRLRSKKDLRRY